MWEPLTRTPSPFQKVTSSVQPCDLATARKASTGDLALTAHLAERKTANTVLPLPRTFTPGGRAAVADETVLSAMASEARPSTSPATMRHRAGLRGTGETIGTSIPRVRPCYSSAAVRARSAA